MHDDVRHFMLCGKPGGSPQRCVAAQLALQPIQQESLASIQAIPVKKPTQIGSYRAHWRDAGAGCTANVGAGWTVCTVQGFGAVTRCCAPCE